MNTSNDAMSDDENNTSLQELDQLPDNQAAELLAEFERRRRVCDLFKFFLVRYLIKWKNTLGQTNACSD